MGLIEAILIGFQFKRLEKPLVLVTMLVALLCFVAMGVVIVLAGIGVVTPIQWTLSGSLGGVKSRGFESWAVISTIGAV